MSDLSGRIQQTLRSSDFLTVAFPMLTDWGVRDEDVMMHSLGCSVWNTLGHELGYMSVVEAPAPAAVGNDIRLDSVWFDRKTRGPTVLVEFERYDGSSRGAAKLDEKLGNLMEAALRWESRPELLILSAWSKGLVSAPDTRAMVTKLRGGLVNSKGVRVGGLGRFRFLFNRFILDSTPSGRMVLRLQSFEEAA